jgi:formate dehydrogenase major subunit
VLIKKSERHRDRGRVASAQPNKASDRPDRRTFLKRSGLAAGTLAALGNLPLGAVRTAKQRLDHNRIGAFVQR